MAKQLKKKSLIKMGVQRSWQSLVLIALTLFSAISATPLDDYVFEYDGNYSWTDTGQTIHGSNVVGTYKIL